MGEFFSPYFAFCGLLYTSSGHLTIPSVPFFSCNAKETSIQVSRGNYAHCQCYTAGFTLPALDGNGLHDLTPARPAVAPDIQFLFVGAHLCSTLPSDPASRRRPCVSLAFTSIRLAEGLPPSKLAHVPGTHEFSMG
ncbi:MAG: hypothetical protein ACHQYP_08605 [Nitrospiria bacterium]